MTQPVSYGPDKMLVGVWVLLVSLPALILGWIFLRSGSTATALPAALTLILPLAVMTFASRFRVTFTRTEFVYRRWGPTVRIAYSDINRIDVTNVTPVTKQAIGAFLVTKRGERLPFWPKLFPREAVDRFFALAG
jgi:hypothetical protein